VQEWWFDCLSSDSLVGSDWDGALPSLIPTNRMRHAFDSWAKSRNIRSRLPGRNDFSKFLTDVAPSLSRVKTRPEDPDDATYSFKNPGLSELRADWERYIGGCHTWS
jgi:hypothetical protein